MAERAESSANDLLQQFHETSTEFIEFVETIPESRWNRVVPGFEWPVNVAVHHIADNWGTAIRSIQSIANGEPLPPMSREIIDHMNAEHAERFANVSKEETLEALRESAEAAAKVISSLTEEQLARESNPLPALGGRGATPRQFIQVLLIGHPREHLPAIREAAEG